MAIIISVIIRATFRSIWKNYDYNNFIGPAHWHPQAILIGRGKGNLQKNKIIFFIIILINNNNITSKLSYRLVSHV